MPRKARKSSSAAKRRGKADAAKSAHGGKREGAGRPRKARHHEQYKQSAGPLPEDPLQVVKWAGRVLALAMEKVLEDPDLEEPKRRHELRITAKVLAMLVPAERLEAAEQIVRGANEEMGRTRKDPEMTPNGPSAPQSSRALRLDS